MGKAKSFGAKIFVSVFLLFAFACTRAENSLSKVTIELPKGSVAAGKAGALSEPDELQYVLINVSGPDLPVRVIAWSADSVSGPCANQVCSFDLPQGDGRVFQVLAVFASATGQVSFKYGDRTQNVRGASVSVDLLVSKLGGTVADPTETQIYGRYLTNASDGPTGNVEVYLHPENGPRMLFGKAEMFRGWFQLFGITGVKFDYVINGASLFGGAKAVDEIMDPSLPSQLKVLYPARYQSEGDSVRFRDKEIQLVGFFGPALGAAHKVCYARPGSAVNLHGLYTTAAMTTPLQYLASGSASQVRVDTVGRPTTACSANASSPLLPSEIYLDPGEGEFGLRVPFARQASGGIVEVSGGIAQVQLLPGVDSSDVVSFEAFSMSEQDLHRTYRIMGPFEQFDCPRIKANVGKDGIEAIGSANNSGAATTTISLSGTVAAGKSVVVCPKRNASQFYLSAGYSWSDGGGGGPYLRLEAMDSDGSGNGNLLLTTGFCHRVRLKSFSGMGSVNNVTADLSITGFPTTGDLQFYTTGDCNILKGTATIPNGSSASEDLFVKGTAAASGVHLTLAPSDPVFVYQGSSNPIDVGSPKLSLSGPRKVITGECYNINVRTLLANGQPYPQVGAGIGINWNFGSDTLVATSPATCTTSTGGSNAISSGASSLNFYSKTASTSGAINLSVSAAGFIGAQIPSVPVSSSESIVTPYLRFTPEAPLEIGMCVPIRAALVNANGFEVPAKADIFIAPQPSTPVLTLHPDTGCGSPSSPATIATGESATYIYGRVLGAASLSLENLTGAYVLDPANPPLMTSAPSMSSYVGFNPPVMGARVIGTHEFGASKTISLELPVGSSLSCREWNGASWNPCASGVLSGSNFIWSQADAVSGKRFMFENIAGGQHSWIEFDPKKIYGQDFEVVSCASILTAPSTTSDVSTALAAGNVCFGNGVPPIDCGTVPISITAAKKLVGWSTAPVTFDYGSSGGGSCFTVTPTASATGKLIMANMSFNIDGTSCSTGTAVGISATGATGPSFEMLISDSNFYVDSISGACASQGVKLWSNNALFQVSFKDTSFDIYGDYLGAAGVVIDNTQLGTVSFDGVEVEGVLGGNQDVRFVRIERSTTVAPGGITVSNSHFSGNRLVIFDAWTGFEASPAITFFGNEVDFYATTASTTAPFYLSAANASVSHVFYNNVLRINPGGGQSAFFLKDDGPNSMNIEFKNNTVVHQNLGSFIIGTSALVNVSNINFTNNSFYSKAIGTGGNSRVFIRSTPTGGNSVLNTSGPSPTGGNRVCEDGGGSDGWATTPDSGATAGNLASLPSTVGGVTPILGTLCP